MSRTTALIAGLMAAGAMAQASFAADGFEYVGCVSASPSAFPVTTSYTGTFSPQECQEANAGKATYVAIGAGCHADDGTAKPTYTTVDESECSTLCTPDDPSSGYCGGGTDGANQVYSLYTKSGGEPEEDCECEDENPVKVICICEDGCGPIKYQETCPPEWCPVGCPEDRCQTIQIVVCETETGCGPIPFGGECPPEGCCTECEAPPAPECEECETTSAAPAPTGTVVPECEECEQKEVIVCEIEEGCGPIKCGEPCPPEYCPPTPPVPPVPSNSTVHVVVVCLLEGGCGNIKFGAPCPTGGCPPGPSPPPAPVCPPEGCPPAAPSCPPEGCPPPPPPAAPSCPPEGCPTPPPVTPPAPVTPSGCTGEECEKTTGTSTAVVTCKVVSGCGSVKYGEACPSSGCESSSSSSCTGEECNKPVYVAGGAKAYAGTFVAAAAALIAGFYLA